MPRPVSRDEFEAAVADSPGSPAFFEQYARFAGFEPHIETEAVVHDGDLSLEGSWHAPGLCTLINGNVVVEDVLDLRSRFDQGGLFIAIGNVSCRHLLGDYSLTTFVDGDLTATQTIITGYGDSALSVIGTMRTRLFIGCDIGADVGAGAEVEYGIGTCAPIGERKVRPIQPRRSEAETIAIVTPRPKRDGWPFDPDQFADLIRAGRPVFK